MSTKEKFDIYESKRNEFVTLAQHAHQISKEIVDADTFRRAVDLLMDVKLKREQWKGFIGPIVKSAYETHKKAKEREREIDLPLYRAENEILKPAIARWSDVEAARRKEKEAELSKEAGVEVQLQNEALAPGISYKMNYSVEVTDLMALVKAVADGTVPLEAVMAKLPFLNNMATNFKTALSWPGVTVKAEKVVSASPGRTQEAEEPKKIEGETCEEMKAETSKPV